MTRIAGRPRAVFDCNTILQAIAFEHGPAAACVRLVEATELELFISKATLAELRRVLRYEEVLAISANMTPVRVGAFIERLTYRATLIRRVPHVMDYPRDPKDEPYIDLAVKAKADYLVSRDKDLLSLMTGHAAVCKQFRQLTQPLRVLDPVAFLNDVGHRFRDTK
jgi:putative PIN family toxin of toxin-antitoxin system